MRTGVKHPYPIVLLLIALSLTLPYLKRLIYIIHRDQRIFSDIVRDIICLLLYKLNDVVAFFSINTHLHLMECACIEYFSFISQFSIEEAAASSLKENLLCVKR